MSAIDAGRVAEYDRRFARYSAVVVALFLAFVGYVGTHQYMQGRAAALAPPRAISSVLLSDPMGHGSGVHIGHGFIITAAHVVADKEDMDVTDSLGRKQPAKVLWANKAYDVALLSVPASNFASTPLNCSAAPPAVGDEVTALGNPLDLEFIHTWGRVAASAAERGPFKQAIIVDMTVAPGMSGGGVFDKAGNLIGIVNAFATAGPFGYAISYIVPISSACHLMGRV